MAFDKKRGLLAALEDFSEGASGGPADDDALMAATVEADTAGEESDAEFQEVEDTREAMEELEDERVRLEGVDGEGGLIGNVEATAPEGGEPELTENEARFVAAEAADIYRRLGVRRSRMPATESFASPSSRKLATKIALEDWKEKAKEIGKAILEYIKQLIQKLVSAWQSLVGTGEKYKKSLDELAKKVSEFKGTPGKVKNSSLAKAFLIEKDGQADERVKDLLGSHINATEATMKATVNFANAAGAFGDENKATPEGIADVMVDLTDKLQKDFDGYFEKITLVQGGIGGAAKKVFNAVFGAETGKQEVSQAVAPAICGPFVGGMVLGIQGTGTGVKAKTGTVPFETAEEFTGISKATMEDAIRQSKSLLALQDRVKGSTTKIEEIGKKLISSIDKPKATDRSDEAGETRHLRSAAMSMVSSIGAIYSIVPRYNISMVGKVIQMVTASMTGGTAEEKKAA